MLHHGSAALLFAISASTSADVVEFENFLQWQAAANDFTMVGFDDFPVFTSITTQYSELGVTFTDGVYLTVGPSLTYPQDDWGLDGNGPIDLIFSQPMTSIAVHHPGTVQFRLFSEGELIYESSGFQGAPSGIDGFAGLISTRVFDSATIFRPTGSPPFIDNLYFSPPIPAPGAGLALLCGLPIKPRRRRQ